MIAFLVDQRTALRRELEETRHEREELRARFGVNAPTTVDYIGAGGIVDEYISPKLQGMSAIHRIYVRATCKTLGVAARLSPPILGVNTPIVLDFDSVFWS